jgi:hypothetical protein
MAESGLDPIGEALSETAAAAPRRRLLICG